jgi:archaellum component FlaF (FlaF/FlaG flagellin family)
MKKIIFSAVFIFALYGYAAAQNSTTKSKQATTKEEKATVKKGSAQKKNSASKTTLKQESSSNAKSDTVRVKFPVPKPIVGPDTTSYPMNKHRRR